MKKILIFAFDNMEDVEFNTMHAVLQRKGHQVDFFTITKSSIKTKFGLEISNPKLLIDLNLKGYDALYLPGGPGVDQIINTEELRVVLDYFIKSKKLVIAICAAPQILAHWGYLKNKQAIAYSDPSIYEFMEANGAIIKNKNCLAGESCEIVQDGTIITALNYETTSNLAIYVDQQLKK